MKINELISKPILLNVRCSETSFEVHQYFEILLGYDKLGSPRSIGKARRNRNDTHKLQTILNSILQAQVEIEGLIEDMHSFGNSLLRTMLL